MQNNTTTAKRLIVLRLNPDNYESVFETAVEADARVTFIKNFLGNTEANQSRIETWLNGGQDQECEQLLNTYLSNPVVRNSTLGVGDVAEIAQVSTNTTDEITKAMKKLQGVISSDEVVSPNVTRMKELANQLADTYARKNKDYGDSFGISVARYGIIAALTRMSDKWNRLENLILNEGKHEVNDESVLDTLLDLAAYALMTYMEVEKGE